jgi:hypothetical protein
VGEADISESAQHLEMIGFLKLLHICLPLAEGSVIFDSTGVFAKPACDLRYPRGATPLIPNSAKGSDHTKL